MELLALAWRYRAHLAIVSCGLVALAWAIDAGLLPGEPLAALVGGYLAYSLGAGAATLALLAGGLLLERERRTD
jgi:hypothetical protein